ncbi:hypothetical protein WG922_20240 [Ramlibacter sp. AN1015]|uniref:hypothetical protein n=1 Tax=Ramlibacter sp. AN1015 TaxID=3133428 RepID=UPI0030C0FC5D
MHRSVVAERAASPPRRACDATVIATPCVVQGTLLALLVQFERWQHQKSRELEQWARELGCPAR